MHTLDIDVEPRTCTSVCVLSCTRVSVKVTIFSISYASGIVLACVRTDTLLISPSSAAFTVHARAAKIAADSEDSRMMEGGWEIL
jgi:hypothetical protein